MSAINRADEYRRVQRYAGYLIAALLQRIQKAISNWRTGRS